jgi:spore coat polysaccharide biosynthesis protein SpsF
MSPRVAVIVVARGASTRLPGKMLLPFGHSTVLSTVIERCAAIQRADDVVLATTDHASDDGLAREGARLGLPVTRGSEQDVVARMVQAVRELPVTPDVIVRACADNPLVMPSVVDGAVDELTETGCDLVTPFEHATLPFGYGFVVMTRACLERIDRGAVEPAYREHVENYCFEHPEHFALRYQVAPPHLAWPELCLTLDYPVDLVRLSALTERLESVPLADQPRALLTGLRAAGVWVEGSSAEPAAGHDLILAVDPPAGLRADLGVVVVDTFEVAGQPRYGLRYAAPRPAGFPSGPIYLDDEPRAGESPLAFLGRAAELALPYLLAAPARPLDLQEAAVPAPKRVHAHRRRGFASPREEAFPREVVLELAAGDSNLLELLLGQLAEHGDTDLCLPDAGVELTARAIERLGAERVHDRTGEPDPFRVLRVKADGQLEVAGARRPLSGTSVAGFWRSAQARAARAEALNRESAP